MGETAFIRQLIARDVFDYQSLLGALSAYAKPRDKITRLLAGGDIVRVKKGLYCFGDAFQREPICLEHLANLIYGPSYVVSVAKLALRGGGAESTGSNPRFGSSL
jgi:hypothetical protein